jgi:two-component system cell cycle sensor histidine kinase/response regulator CckA
VTTRRLTAGGQLLRLVVATDATDRRKAEGELQERDDLFRNVLTNVPCAVFWKDRASIYLGCNDQAARDLGLSVPGEVIGQTDYRLALDPAEAERARDADRRVIDAAEPAARRRGGAHTFRRHTGHLPHQPRPAPRPGRAGDRRARRVPERDRPQAAGGGPPARPEDGRGRPARRGHGARLQQPADHRHRQRPPPARAAGRRPGGGGYVDEIQAAVDRATALTRQLLAFSRKQPARPEVLDLNDVVAGMAGLLARLIGNRVTIRTELAAEPVRVRADRGHLEQVLMNLAANAPRRHARRRHPAHRHRPGRRARAAGREPTPGWACPTR